MTIIMSIIMLISINTNVESFSVEKEKFLYIESEPVSKSCVKYLKEEQINIFSSLKDVVADELYKLNDRDRIDFGNGFVLNQIGYIPILCNNKIIAFKPIYLGCEGKYTYKKSRHALVLRGYNIDRNTYLSAKSLECKVYFNVDF